MYQEDMSLNWQKLETWKIPNVGETMGLQRPSCR